MTYPATAVLASEDTGTSALTQPSGFGEGPFGDTPFGGWFTTVDAVLTSEPIATADLQLV